MTKVSIYVNTINTYHSGYRHLNEPKYLGEFKELGSKVVKIGEEYHVRTFTVVGPKNICAYTAIRGLTEEYSNQCSHEHDCCGCVSTYAGVKVTRKGQFFVTVHSSKNV